MQNLNIRRFSGREKKIKGFGRDKERDQKVKKEAMGFVDKLLNFFGCFSDE